MRYRGSVQGRASILIDLSSWYRESLAPKIETIQDGIENRRIATFRYYSPSGESDRTVEPYYLVFRWSSWYLWAWCCDRKDFKRAVDEAARKKKQNFSKVEFLTIEEGLCVQCMHIGPYEDEPATVAMMDQYLAENRVQQSNREYGAGSLNCNSSFHPRLSVYSSF